MSEKPHHASNRGSRLDQALLEYVRRLEQGEPVSLHELMKRNPETVAALRDCLAAIAGGNGPPTHAHYGDETPGRSAAPSTLASTECGEGLAAGLPHTMPHVTQGLGKADELMQAVGASSCSSLTRSRYRILRAHARGGLGEVYVAQDEELHREVALKEIQARHAHDETSRTRFVLEAEVTGALEHPGIVPVYGLGIYADGRPYYAMRFIQGETFQDAIDRFHGKRRQGITHDQTEVAEQGSHAAARGESQASTSYVSTQSLASGERAVQFRKLLGPFISVCNAIAYAHSRGVLHRDLKPANVMLGKFGETLVVDWGLAKLLGRGERPQSGDEPVLERPSSGESSPTQVGRAIGTPQYMSPEQAAGRLHELGPASDIYSLGATLYSLLTGQMPFNAPDVRTTLRRVSEGQFASPRAVYRQTPRPLEAICLKAMALKPEDRYTSARQLADDVEHWLAGEPVAAYPEPWTLRARRWMGRHRSLMSGLAAAVVVAVVTLTLATVLLQRANHELVASNRRETVAKQQSERSFHQAQQAVDDYLVRVSESRLLRVPGMQPLRKELLETALEYYQEFLRNRPANSSSKAELAIAYDRIGVITSQIGSKAEALRASQRGLDLWEQLARDEPATELVQYRLAMALNEVGMSQAELGKTTEALRLFKRARRIWDQHAKDDAHGESFREGRAKTLNNLARLLQSTGEHTQALTAFRQAAEVREQLLREQPRNDEIQDLLASTYSNLGILQSELGLPREAIQSYQRANSIWEALVREQPSVFEFEESFAKNLHNIAFLQSTTGLPDQALAGYRRVIEIRERLVRDNPTIRDFQTGLASTRNNLGMLLSTLGHDQEALEHYDRAIALQLKLVTDNPGFVELQDALAASHNNAGLLYGHLGRPNDAIHSLREAVRYRQQLLRDHPELASIQSALAMSHDNLGVVLHEARQPTEALDCYQSAKKLQEALRLAHPENLEFQFQLGVTWRLMGGIFAELGRPDEALRALEHAIEQMQPAFDQAPLEHLRQQLSDAHVSLAAAQANAGRTSDAVRSLQRSIAMRKEMAALGAGDFYNQACCFSLLSRLSVAGRTEVDDQTRAMVEEYAVQAVDLLRQAINHGFRQADAIRKDPDLEPLHQREDFEKLLAELEAETRGKHE